MGQQLQIIAIFTFSEFHFHQQSKQMRNLLRTARFPTHARLPVTETDTPPKNHGPQIEARKKGTPNPAVSFLIEELPTGPFLGPRFEAHFTWL